MQVTIGLLGAAVFSAPVVAADLSLSLATEAASAAVESCKVSGYNVTVTVMAPDMATRVVLRGDGAPERTVQIAYRKAYTVLKSGMSSGEFGKSQPPQPAPPAGSPPGPVNGDANLITWAGGIAIKAGETVLGSISASGAPGGEKDEACVKAGIAKIASKLK